MQEVTQPKLILFCFKQNVKSEGMVHNVMVVTSHWLVLNPWMSTFKREPTEPQVGPTQPTLNGTCRSHSNNRPGFKQQTQRHLAGIWTIERLHVLPALQLYN